LRKHSSPLIVLAIFSILARQFDLGVDKVMPASLSFAVCSNRPHNFSNVGHLVNVVGDDDEVILVADLQPKPAESMLLADLSTRGVGVMSNGSNRGLSYSRNRALAKCRHRHLVYVDDDISLVSDTVEAIREAVSAGAGIVGVWLQPRFSAPRPWWLTGGQYHYLGVHHALSHAKTWGACMAVDVDLARTANITFREELGRRGKSLQSGDDTTFLNELRAAGAVERFLADAVAYHEVSLGRIRPGYLLRRAWWQGRSEVRRSSAMTSLGKEWRRGVAAGPDAAGTGLRYALASVYTGAVASGIATEVALRIAKRRSGHA
jgi:hypothetical protein